MILSIRIVYAAFVVLSTASFLPAQDPLQQATSRLRSIYFQRNFEGGALEGEKLTTEFSDAFELKAWFVLNMSRSNQAEEAVALAEGMTTGKPHDPWGWFALAGALNWFGGRGSDALAASEKALALSPGNPDMIWMRAETLLRQERREDAVAFVDKYRDRVRNPAELLATKGNHNSNQPLEFQKSD